MWRTYGLASTVLEKSMRPASKVLDAIRKASERTTLLRGCGGGPS